MPPPSYPFENYSTNTRSSPSLPSLSSTQNPNSDKRSSEWQSFSNKPGSRQPPFSPNLQFQQVPNKSSQPSPSLPSIFSLQGGTDLTSNQASGSTEHNSSNQLTLPNAFSPSVFGRSPPSFLAEASLAIAPTPPSNPQYATFPFDTPRTNPTGPAHSGLGGTGTGTVLTPGAQSHPSGSHTAGSETGNIEKDPFLNLLEQLAENEHSLVGPSELDFFLTGEVDQDGEI